MASLGAASGWFGVGLAGAFAGECLGRAAGLLAGVFAGVWGPDWVAWSGVWGCRCGAASRAAPGGVPWGSAGAAAGYCAGVRGGVWDLGAAARVWGRAAGSWCGAVVGTVFCLWRVLVRFLGCAGGGPAAWVGSCAAARGRARCGLAGGVLCAGLGRAREFGPVGVGGYR